ncbi:unnamed protein product [Boreogadus saida]
MQSNSQCQYPADGEIPGTKRVAAPPLPFSSLRPDQTHLFSPVVQTFRNRFHLLELARANPSSPVSQTSKTNPNYKNHWVRNGSDRKGAGWVAFPPPKVGVTRTLPYPIRHHSGDCSVAVPKTLAWANKEVETFVCILGEEDVVYDVYVAAAAIDIRPTTKGTVGSGNATSELSWANRSLPTAPLRSDPFRTLQWKCGIREELCAHPKK